MIDISVTLMVSHYIRNHKSASVITQTWTHLTLLSKMETLSAQANPRGGKLEGGHQPTCHGEHPGGRSNRLTAQILECALVGGSHNKRVNSDMLSPSPPPYNRLCPGSLFKKSEA